MTGFSASSTPTTHIATDRVGTGQEASTAQILAFAEATALDATGPQMRPTGFTLHLLGPACIGPVKAGEMRAEATIVGLGNPQLWRIAVSAGGQPVAEVLATFAVAAPADADAAPDAPEAAQGALPGSPRDAGQEPVSKRRPEAEARRARIALAARDVFAEKGYATATMREVAAAAGMHVPTMYQYVRSKEELLELVYDWTISHAVAGMDAVLTAPGPPEDRLDAIVRRLHDVNRDLRRGTLVMNRETRALSRAARIRILGEYAGMVDRIAEVITEGQRAGAFRGGDPRLAAVFIDALADVWVLRPFAVGQIDYDTYSAELSAFVRGALGAVAQAPGEPGSRSQPNRQESER